MFKSLLNLFAPMIVILVCQQAFAKNDVKIVQGHILNQIVDSAVPLDAS